MAARFGDIFRPRREEGEHAEVRNLSSDYIEGDLDRETTDWVKAHLEWCPPCQAFIDTLRATVGLLGSSKGKKEVPPAFRERLRERLEQEEHR